MRRIVLAFALLLTTGAAGANIDPGSRRLADAPRRVAERARSPTGGAVLDLWPATPSIETCAADLVDTRCGERSALAAYVRREAEIARLSAGWDAPVQHALTLLRRAERRYASAIARNEVDRRGGADRVNEAQAAAEAQDEAFVSLLRRTADETGRSVAIDASPADTGATMDSTYALVMAEPIGPGSVTRDGVRETQAAWLAYRHAFVALATALDRPSAPIEVELSSLRTRDLEGLIAD